MSDESIKKDVRRFYNEVGWQQISEGVYQNALFEDLRPVSRTYIHRCHLRVKRYLSPIGHYFLDAGSGPVQYPEYLTYSQGYRYRVCLDISMVALKEARKRIGDHGLYVVADVAHLPFCDNVFDGIVSLHTIHHVPKDDHLRAYMELKRVLSPEKRAVVVNGWEDSAFMRLFRYPILFMERITRTNKTPDAVPDSSMSESEEKTQGTFVQKMNAESLRDLLKDEVPIQIKVWRSVSVRFLRALIHSLLLGRLWLNGLYLFEEAFPRFFGEKGQYPLIILEK